MATRVRTRTSGIRRKRRAKGDVYEVRFRDAEGVQRSRTFPTPDQARRSGPRHSPTSRTSSSCCSHSQ